MPRETSEPEITEPRLGAADTAWWRMDEPTNPMVITGVLTLGTRVGYDVVEARIRERLLPLAPFRSRLREPALGIGRPRWEPDPDFRLDRHLTRAHLAAPAGDAELQAFVSQSMSERLDPRHPLWQLHLVDFGDGSALVARIHHCIADGMALIQLLLTLDDTPGNEGPAGLSWSRAPTAAAASSPAGPPAWERPAGIRAAGWVGASLARLVAARPDPATALSGALGMRKGAAWCEPFPLDALRDAARATGSTLNDVLAATIGGALARYLAETGRGVPRRGLRAVGPVNLRPPDDASLLGNRFGLVFLTLPMGETDAAGRLAHVRSEMQRLKRSAEAGLTYGLLRAFGPLGRPVVRLAVWFLGMKATLVFTNVPGPREPVTVCGAPLTGVMAWVPQSGRLSVGVSAVSYAGKVQIGIAADSGLVPDPAALVDCFRAALAELIESTAPASRG